MDPSSNHTQIFQRSVVVNPHSASVDIDEHKTFTVVSFNILAEVHRVRADYSYTEEQYLLQDYRHQLLLKDLRHLDADVVCLQEVGPTYYATMLLPAMEQLGYTGNFIKRTQEYFDEGEATFVKTDRFSVEGWTCSSLSQLILKEVNAKNFSPEVRKAIRSYLDRSEVINICRLRCKLTSQSVTVGNVHIVWDDYRWPDVKALEIANAVKELVVQAGSDSCPHILCGDFNSVPTSVGYQLAQDGYLSDSNIASLQAVENLKLQTGSKSLVTYLSDLFKHNSSTFRSAYFACKGHELGVSCYDRESFGCFDYIWFNQSGLLVTQVLDLPEEKILDSMGGLPNKLFSSDHLPMKATFLFRTESDKVDPS